MDVFIAPPPVTIPYAISPEVADLLRSDSSPVVVALSVTLPKFELMPVPVPVPVPASMPGPTLDRISHPAEIGSRRPDVKAIIA
jgi:hypothetical protein